MQDRETKCGKSPLGFGDKYTCFFLSMLRKFDWGDFKTTDMTLKLAEKSILYLYGVMGNMSVEIIDFVFLNINEYLETPLRLERILLESERAIIDVEIGDHVEIPRQTSDLQCLWDYALSKWEISIFFRLAWLKI